jgi:hypothetical protein
VYSALLSELTLSPEHRQNLRRRGLSDDEIDFRGYRTLPDEGRRYIARKVEDREILLPVPGFVVRHGNLTIAGPAGMLIPCVDDKVRIVALKIRIDNPGDGPKYIYLSSSAYGGPGPGSPVHFPVGWGQTDIHSTGVRLTEGELKSDVSTVLSKYPTISMPGASVWRPALAAIRPYTDSVRLAFDADARKNKTVAGALLACARAVIAADMELALETWDESDGKGIDDLLLAGQKPQVLRGEAALMEAERIADKAGCRRSSIWVTRTRKGHLRIRSRMEVTL